MNRLCLPFFTLMLAFALPASGLCAVYKHVAPDGSVTYSDKPGRGAETVDLPAMAAPVPAPAPATAATPATSAPEAGKLPADANAPDTSDAAGNSPQADNKPPVVTAYTKLDIVKPEADGTVRENSGTVDVEVAVEPALDAAAGHKITVLLNGKPAAEGQTPQLKLENVERGSHVLEAQVSDAQGAVMATSNAVTFHMKRFSALFIKKSPLAAPTLSTPETFAFPRAPQ